MQRLKKIFPSLIIYEEVDHKHLSEYQWFRTKEQEVIGILKKQMTPEGLALLNVFLIPHNIQFPVATVKENEWKEAVQQKQTESLEVTNACRFIAFSFNRAQMNPIQFKVAICELFNREVPILWESEWEGIIIEEKTNEAATYEEIIDVLMSDLYVKIKFLVGTYFHCTTHIEPQYEAIREAAGLAFQHSERNVISFIDAVPYFFMYGDGSSRRSNLRKLVLQEFESDRGTLEMIETLIHHNLNISETAKALHLHRNSLQYRLNRLFERTGLDVRKFHHAMTSYLIL